MAFMNSLVLVMALLATSLGVHGVSLPTTARSLSGCGYQSTTGRETLYAGKDQQEVGFVDWTLSDAGVTVKYTITSECYPGTAHVELSETELLRPTPGRFDCTTQGSGRSVTVICGNEYLADLSCCSTKYLYTHLELTCGDELETSYAGEERCSGRSWCNYVKIDPPCDGCACDGKCLAKQTCPDGCDGDKLFCPETFDTSCTKKVVCDCAEELVCPLDCPQKEVCQDGCNGEDLFCPADVPMLCTKKVRCDCGGDEVCPVDLPSCPPKVRCDCSGDFVCLADLAACNQKLECVCGGDFVCRADVATCPQKVQCPGDCNEGVTACSLEACPLCCPDCFEPGVVDGVQTCVGKEGELDAGCNPCQGVGSKICQELGGLPSSFGCCPPRSNCKGTILTDRLGDGGIRDITFVCSSSCGGPCDSETNDGTSAGCALFSPIILGSDGDLETDDIFNVCNGEESLTVDTCPETGECTA